MKASSALAVLVIGMLFSCSPTILSFQHPSSSAPQTHDNAQLLAKAIAPVVVVSVSKIRYQTLRHRYNLYDVLIRDKEGALFIFASTEWGNLKPGDIIKYDNVIVGDKE